ncbi:DUF1176 domain-containing protein [Psychrobacter ciconiae]|uniref:DUF1176 domain-containing protein n=1 Tax=Psychrobacter ciconiae TaxID=1553449 RepID=UPI00191ACE2F|nr:DUF1176 domain-containing protein [Psychrobacter ciconiae]
MTKKLHMLAPLLLAFGTITAANSSLAAPSVEFSNQDWQVVCDNTRTCRLAGYQEESNSDFPVSVLLIRKAGANAGVIGKVKIGGGKQSSSKALMQLGNRHNISLVVNGEDLGVTKPFSSSSGDADLTQKQVETLINALAGDSKIEVVFRNTRWQLSDKGARAVMLKADEAQGRVGTPSAFIKGNSRPNSSVLPPKAAPQLRWVEPTKNVRHKKFSMKASQLKALIQGSMKDWRDSCPNIDDDTSWQVNRLSGSQLLVRHSCWVGAYNAGSGAWVINDKPPHRPVLVTTSATDYSNGKIKAVQKGRGIGDCLNQEEWIWTGRQFAKSHDSTTGLCRLIEAGGAWQLPRFVSEVKIS